MSLGAITGSGNAPDIRGAAASARPGSVAASLAAQARFDALDAVQLATRQAAQQTKPNGAKPNFDSSRRDGTRAGSDQSGSRPSQSSSVFLAQSLAQEQDQSAAAPVTSAAISGTAAYARTASRSAPPDQDTTAEILLPLQPSLNSGRTLDLAV